jgi:hypothetical protein
MRYQDAVTTDATGHTAGDLRRLSLVEPGDAETLGDNTIRG